MTLTPHLYLWAIVKVNPIGMQWKDHALGQFGVDFNKYKLILFWGELTFWGEFIEKILNQPQKCSLRY